MSVKPEDIPQDVWGKASGVWSESRIRHMSTGMEYGPIVIARAIMAAEKRGEEREREACAEMLECGFSRDGVTHKTDECSHGRFGYEDCELCAAVTIRKRQSELG